MRIASKPKNARPAPAPAPAAPPTAAAGPDAKFRETLWFKKGVLDAAEAERASGTGDDLAATAVDSLPLQDRYRDDGNVTQGDTQSYGVHTGTTQWVEQEPKAPTPSDFEPGDLVREMRRTRMLYLAMIVGGLAALGISALLLF